MRVRRCQSERDPPHARCIGRLSSIVTTSQPNISPFFLFRNRWEFQEIWSSASLHLQGDWYNDGRAESSQQNQWGGKNRNLGGHQNAPPAIVNDHFCIITCNIVPKHWDALKQRAQNNIRDKKLISPSWPPNFLLLLWGDFPWNQNSAHRASWAHGST